MRVTIKHREETAGITGSTKHYFLDCAVAFGEEEKAIIAARNLKHINFSVPSPIPYPKESSFWTSAILNSVGRFSLIFGIPLAFFSSFTKSDALGILAGFMVFGGAALWLGAAIAGRMQNRAENYREQNITLAKLLSHGQFTCLATTPVNAKKIEDDIKQHLTKLKGLLKESAELQKESTFEL